MPFRRHELHIITFNVDMRNRRIIFSIVFALCLLQARAQSWLTAGPYLQELTPDGVTVVFEHGIPSVSWIEVREKGSTETTSYFQTVNGRVKAYSQILTNKNSAQPVQNFAIRAEGLKPATTYEYRIKAHKTLQHNSEGFTASMTTSSSYSSTWKQFTTQDPNQTEHHIFITSDMHNKPDSLEALLKFLDYKTCDRIIYNGDMTNYMQFGDQDPYKGFINKSVSLFAQNKPFEFVRGNHETRGNMSRRFMDYFPHKSGHIYNAYRWGDLEMILLDSGEDKVDSDKEYYGMASFYSYREEMARWLEELIKTDEFRTAKYRIVICHFTLLSDDGKPTDRFGGEPQLISLILPLLKKCDIDLVISGHIHPATYTYMGKNYKGKGNQFEEYNIGAHSGMRIDIADGNVHLKIVSTEGKVLLDKNTKDVKANKIPVYITSRGNGQPALVPDGYYALSPFLQDAAGLVYTYDTDALRNPYGNATDYAHPLGKNGEHAYLYCQNSGSANLANRTFYLRANADGSYTVQSCSGEPYSFLDIASYDRHLAIHSAREQHTFGLYAAEHPSFAEGEYMMQQVQGAVLFDSLASEVHGLENLQMLTPLDSVKITPAIVIRRALGEARGILALYPPGDNPGQVSPLLSNTLRGYIEEAQALAENKNTTPEQAEEVVKSLLDSAHAYKETASTALNPITDGFYWLTCAYRAFELRQGKQKVMRVQETDGQVSLRWNNANISDGATAFRITPGGDCDIMQDYLGRWSGRHLFRYDTEGMFTICDADMPDHLLSANDSWIGEKGLYGKPAEGPVTARPDNYLYPGYCSSWFLQRACHQVTTPTTGWAVLSVSFPVEVPEGVEVFSVSEKDGLLHLVPYLQPVIPARTAVVVYASKGTYTFWSTTAEMPAIEGNVLVANCEDRKDMASGSMALLKVKNGQVGFQKSTQKTISAGSAYIPYSDGQDEFRVLQDAEDAIEVIGDSPSGILGKTAYDLSGRHVGNRMKRGLIIQNNKKMLRR